MFDIKKYKSIICPICEKFKFTAIQDGDEIPPWCYSCGWIYDSDQIENFDLKEGENRLSLREYILWYKYKIEENPDYDYSEENEPEQISHKCPVCEKYEFKEEGSYDICPYCGWEDDDIQLDDPDYPNGANEMSLNEYKKDYYKKINNNPKYKWIKNIQNNIKKK